MNEDSQASKQARATRDDYGFYGCAPRFRQNQQQQQHSYGSGKIIEESKHKNTHTPTY